jgi:hypothetical protein
VVGGDEPEPDAAGSASRRYWGVGEEEVLLSSAGR